MPSTSGILDESLQLANLLSVLIPLGVNTYNKIAANNQDAGLAPMADLLADSLAVGQQIEKAADAEIASTTPLTPPDSTGTP